MQLTTAIDIALFTDFLSEKGMLNPNEKIEKVEIPGEGNMNVVLRVITGHRSFIAKQSRPFVQKYQNIPAPIDRIGVEHSFYKTVQGSGIDAHLPGLLGFLPEHYMLFLEDLGQSEDMSFIYRKRSISDIHFNQLVSIAKGIHSSPITVDYPKNLELRKLNHQHIFVLPFLEDNGFSLDGIQVGLDALSLPFKTAKALKEKVEELGVLYLTTDGVLLHGDYYPGSWMAKADDVYVLDPEFSYQGPLEFDLGVLVAHLCMAIGDTGFFDKVIGRYDGRPNVQLVREFAGIEIIRRLIGLAQLPLDRTIGEKEQLLHLAERWVRGN
ncbi:phosphotransferase [Muricauda sp. SCSIO 64092]|uniref:phosphotransferase n=1 Tax=Allomuricauda sp. SCSIO 64092 TaxID=2908842 RepID=UPI001FF4E4E2|nr:phosphotransferase [Muricauda sp. SCSIO 64092]UOY06494.1 phosphotransferase [Muricauda sp. SCSIO 64092]